MLLHSFFILIAGLAGGLCDDGKCYGKHVTCGSSGYCECSSYAYKDPQPVCIQKKKKKCKFKLSAYIDNSERLNICSFDNFKRLMYVKFGLLIITAFSKYSVRTVSNNKLLDGKL